MIEPQTARDRAPRPLEIAVISGPLREPLAGNVLACLQFGAASAAGADPRVAPVRLAVHSGAAHGAIHNDLWTSALPVTTGVTDGIHHADNGEILFGWTHVPEAQLSDMEQAAHDIHVRMHRLLRHSGFAHWLRAWNYLSSINEGEGDRERYRQFTAGRHRGLSEAMESAGAFERALPAATAIGTHGAGGLTVCFFAGRAPGIQVENPRQTSAFEYPRVYGPKSPSFSRATLQRWQDRSVLFVSGTASIVGHATIHPGDAAAQLEETLRNLDTLAQHAAQEHLPGGAQFQPRAFKLYVRDEQWMREIEPRWREALEARAPTVVLIGELCRSDLLVEVEAVYEAREPS